MKNDISLLAVSLGLLGSAAYLLSRAHPVFTADSLVGYGVVVALLAMAALDYRIYAKSSARR
jgi:putative effector of murein hydrolase